MTSMNPVRRALVASSLFVVTLVSCLVATPASAAGARYVVLGDSYSAGVGAGPVRNDGTDCQRSLSSFGGIIAQRSGLALDLQACSGAVSADVLNSQVGALNASTDYVSISVGGNDVGFASVITECAKPGWMSDCGGSITSALTVAQRDLPARLDRLYAEIRTRAPRARVVVAGYPRLFSGRDCHILTFFSGDEMTRLNAAADTLDGILAAAARRAGFAFADVRPTFTGHAVCDKPEWIHNLSLTVSESYHPTADGYRSGYTPPVAAQLGVSSTPSSQMSVRTGAQTSSDPSRGRVLTPDLTSPEARLAARRAGVTHAELDRLVVAQRGGASNAQLEAMSESAVG